MYPQEYDKQRRRRRRVLLLGSLIGSTVTAVAFFAAGAVWPGLGASAAGLVVLAAAGRHARPVNWTPED